MRLVYGVGINDAGYPVKGKLGVCKYYEVWKGMLQRCYSERARKNRPSYNSCEVVESWLTFSNFRIWMEKQDWKDKHLDKDLIEKGNKIYAPDKCIFISPRLNMFVVGSVRKKHPDLPPNVTRMDSGAYRVGGTDENGRGIYLCSTYNLDVAKETAMKHKREMAKIILDSEDDPFISSLIVRHYNLKGESFESM